MTTALTELLTAASVRSASRPRAGNIRISSSGKPANDSRPPADESGVQIMNNVIKLNQVTSEEN